MANSLRKKQTSKTLDEWFKNKRAKNTKHVFNEKDTDFEDSTKWLKNSLIQHDEERIMLAA